MYKNFISLIILSRSDFNSLAALECFQTKRRSWNHLPPGLLPQGKSLSTAHTHERLQGWYGFVSWIWDGSYLVWTGSWQIILIKAQKSFPDIQDQSRTGQRNFLSEPSGMAPALHFFWLVEPFRIFVSRLCWALWRPFRCGWLWFLFRRIFFLLDFLFAQLPRWLIQLF